jgi:hypothetical protein
VDFLQLHRRVAHVTLADGHRRRLAVGVVTPTPTATKNIHQHIALATAFAQAVKRAAAHVAFVGGRYDTG